MPEETLRVEGIEMPVGSQEEETPEVLETEAAFVVYLGEDGHWIANSEFLNRPVLTKRQANHNDLFHAASDISKDLMALEAAQRTLGLQTQFAAAMAAKQREAEVNAKIANDIAGVPGGGIDLSKLKG